MLLILHFPIDEFLPLGALTEAGVTSRKNSTQVRIPHRQRLTWSLLFFPLISCHGKHRLHGRKNKVKIKLFSVLSMLSVANILLHRKGLWPNASAPCNTRPPKTIHPKVVTWRHMLCCPGESAKEKGGPWSPDRHPTVTQTP